MSEEKLVEALRLFCDAMDNAIQVLRKELETSERKSKSIVHEDVFNALKWDPATGEKLGEFEISYRGNNEEPKQWDHAFEILRSSEATIKNRYYGPGYVYGYWLYGQDRIYRKKLKEKTTQ